MGRNRYRICSGLGSTVAKLEKQERLVTHFDYEVLTPQQRLIVQQRTGEIRERLQRTAQDIWEIGQRLADVRAQLKYGQFDAWLKAEFGWSRRTAYNFINVYETFRERANLSQFDIATSALYLLAAPSTSQDLRDQYLKQAQAGKKVTHKDLRKAIEQEKFKPVTTVDSAESSAAKPEIITLIPRPAATNDGSNENEQLEKQPSNSSTRIPTLTVQAGWYLLEHQHFIFCGDTAKPEFYKLIPEAALALAVTSQDWEHEWLIDAAKSVIILQESSLSTQRLEQLIAMFSQENEIVIFPWLPQKNMIAIAHKLKRKVFAGDSSSERCHQAILASGLNATPIEV